MEISIISRERKLFSHFSFPLYIRFFFVAYFHESFMLTRVIPFTASLGLERNATQELSTVCSLRLWKSQNYLNSICNLHKPSAQLDIHCVSWALTSHSLLMVNFCANPRLSASTQHNNVLHLTIFSWNEIDFWAVHGVVERESFTTRNKLRIEITTTRARIRERVDIDLEKEMHTENSEESRLLFLLLWKCCTRNLTDVSETSRSDKIKKSKREKVSSLWKKKEGHHRNYLISNWTVKSL